VRIAPSLQTAQGSPIFLRNKNFGAQQQLLDLLQFHFVNAGQIV